MHFRINENTVMEKYEDVIARMDRAGWEGTPFLFVLDYEKHEGVFIAHPFDQHEVLFKVGDKANFRPEGGARLGDGVPFKKHPMPQEEYAQRFGIVQAALRDGSVSLANLTVPTPIDVPLSLKEILYGTRARYQLYVPQARFVCFSPEQFVGIDAHGQISTCPMKGTITGDTPGAPDVILNDYKETSEHCAAVDLLRRDLAGVAENVRVSRFRFFTEIQTLNKRLYQVSSELRGDLTSDWQGRLGIIIDALLPAGSILGSPRQASRELLTAAEKGSPRGFYCGIFGYFDGATLDSAVLIRFIREDSKGQKFYHSGGGVTLNSTLEKEYREVIEKVYLPLQ